MLILSRLLQTKKMRTSAECSPPPQDTVIPVRRRIRNKSTPHIKRITHDNNITIAHATPLPTPKTIQTVITHQKALVTRGDLVATSKYYKYHKSLGHTPQNIQQVAGTQKGRLLAESGLPAQMHTKVFLVHDRSIISKKQKQQTCTTTADISQASPRTTN